MKTWKKLLSLALVAIMTMALLAACGGSEEEKTDAGSTNNGSAATTDNGTAAATTTDGVINIRLYRDTFNLGAVDQDQVKKVEKAMNDYMASKGMKITVTLTDIINSEYPEKANLALLGKEVDLLWTASWQSVIGTNDLFANKAAYDLSDIIVGTDVYNSMAESQWEAGKYDGKIYYIPVYKDNVEGYDILYRQDLADQYGFDFTNVKTLKDLEPMLETLKNAGIRYPFTTQSTALFYRFYLDQFDFFTQTSMVAVDRATNTVVNPILTDYYKEYCTLMSEWVEKGYLSEDDVQKVVSVTALQTQDWGMSWWTDIPVNDEADSRYGQDVSVTPLTSRWAHSTSALGSCYAVAATVTPEVAKACVDFMGLLYTDSAFADIYTFGIEGEDFTYDANHQIVQNSEKYNHSMWESASATVVTPLNNEPANKASLYDTFNGGAFGSCASGFRYDKAPVESEYTACYAVFEEYGFVLENGGFASADVPAKIQAYQAALDAAGYQKMLAEFQSQYDAWKK